MTNEGKKNKFAYGIVVSSTKNSQCSTCNAKQNDYLHNDGINFKIVLSNENYPDFVLVANQYLISIKAKTVLLEENISPVDCEKFCINSKEDLSTSELKDLKDRGYNTSRIATHPPEYFTVNTPIGGEVHEQSNINLAYKCPTCGHEKYATIGYTYVNPLTEYYINESSWNGYDLFRIKQLGKSLFCTDKFVEVYKRYKLTGLEFVKVLSL